jgi:hypothetical protein
MLHCLRTYGGHSPIGFLSSRSEPTSPHLKGWGPVLGSKRGKEGRWGPHRRVKAAGGARGRRATNVMVEGGGHARTTGGHQLSGRRGRSGRHDSSSGDLQKRKEEVGPGNWQQKKEEGSCGATHRRKREVVLWLRSGRASVAWTAEELGSGLEGAAEGFFPSLSSDVLIQKEWPGRGRSIGRTAGVTPSIIQRTPTVLSGRQSWGWDDCWDRTVLVF